MPISPWKFKHRTLTHEEWLKEGKKRFGNDKKTWKFVCVMCGHVHTFNDFLDAGIDAEQANGYIAYSCIGRFVEDKGCNWTLGGLFQNNTLSILPPEDMKKSTKRPAFEFYENPYKLISKDKKNKSRRYDTRDQRKWLVEEIRSKVFKIILLDDNNNQFLKETVQSDSHLKALQRYIKNEDKDTTGRRNKRTGTQ